MVILDSVYQVMWIGNIALVHAPIPYQQTVD